MNIVDNTELQDSQNPFRIILSGDEKEICLQEIIKRLKKIIYVYEDNLCLRAVSGTQLQL